MGARKEPLLMVISTQAADDAVPLSRLIDYGLKVRAKDIRDPSFHLSLHCANPDDDPWSLKTWRKANPRSMAHQRSQARTRQDRLQRETDGAPPRFSRHESGG
jgi:phage terminase large subunit-like protein